MSFITILSIHPGCLFASKTSVVNFFVFKILHQSVEVSLMFLSFPFFPADSLAQKIDENDELSCAKYKPPLRIDY